MSALDSSRLAVDQASGVSSAGFASENGDNGDSQITVVTATTKAVVPQSLAESRATTARQPLLYVAAAMAAGIVVDRYWPLSVTVCLVVAAVALGVWCIFSRRTTLQLAAGVVTTDAPATPFVAAATVPPSALLG